MTTKRIGKIWVSLCLLLLTLAGSGSMAAVTASLDRDRVALGDTLQLTISATDNEDLADIDLRPLLADFEILRRSTRSNTSWINGRRTDTRQMLLDITPRREGSLRIPPLRLGRKETNLLLVAVGPPPAATGGGQTVLFEAEVDRNSVYVQGQIILTLRLQQAINLEDRSITDLQLDNAFVKALEQKSFQRTVDNRPWLVHEVRYAIFPEQSGTLEIPAQTFSARESQPRRSFFDLGGGGRQLRRNTQPLTIEVLPRPDTFPAGTWLPARNLTLEETWSTPPEQLRVGESSTRTIRIQAEGLQGAQLPPVLFPATAGLKYYPDQPVIADAETGAGLLGSRQDSVAVVPTRAGSLEIPELRIPWWDTESGRLRYAVLPARELSIAAADPSGEIMIPVTPPAIEISSPLAIAPVNDSGKTLPWIILSIINGAGWLLTLGYLIWSRRRPRDSQPAESQNPGEKQAYHQLLKACDGGNALLARQSLIDWATAVFPDRVVVSLDQVAAVMADDILSAELDKLNAALYGDSGQTWVGAELTNAVKRLRSHLRQGKRGPDRTLQLYPQAA